MVILEKSLRQFVSYQSQFVGDLLATSWSIEAVMRNTAVFFMRALRTTTPAVWMQGSKRRPIDYFLVCITGSYWIAKARWGSDMLSAFTI